MGSLDRPTTESISDLAFVVSFGWTKADTEKKFVSPHHDWQNRKIIPMNHSRLADVLIGLNIMNL